MYMKYVYTYVIPPYNEIVVIVAVYDSLKILISFKKDL